MKKYIKPVITNEELIHECIMDVVYVSFNNENNKADIEVDGSGIFNGLF